MKVLDYDGLKQFKDYLLPYYIGSTPNYYRRASLPSSNRTTVTVYANTQVNIGNKGYISTKDTTLDISTVGSASDRAGKDVYIYACQPESGTEPVFVLSMNSTVPDGYDENNSRKIGGFHCLCLAVGTISGHTLSGYDTGDILPTTHWDLLFRSVSDNEGMFYSSCGKWFGIYLASWDGSKIVSAYQGEIIDGYSSKSMHGEMLNERLTEQGMRLPWRDEFAHFAKGSNEETNISGSSDPGTTGGHTDTAGRRMISNEGAEDCCGAMWQWCSDMNGAFNATGSSTTYQYGGASTDHANYYLMGYGWDSSYGDKRLVDTNIDGSSSYGDMFGALVRFLVGGHWDDGSDCGSRAVHLNRLSTRRDSNRGGRCAAESRAVSL